jgi:mannose-6-phosphate isomerase-like protein (cupin superfamily)
MKILTLVLAAATAALAAADAPPAATYKPEAELMAALKAGQATPDMLTSEVQNTDRHRINVVRRTKAAGAVAHPGFAELHHIIDGSGNLVTGGTIADRKIQGGDTRHVAKGDVVLIPPGVPHWYTDLTGTITYLEVRWEEK